MSRRLDLSDDAEGLAVLARATWWLRAFALGVVAAIALSAHGGVLAALVELSLCVAATLVWWASERLPAPISARLLFGALSVLAGVGAFAAASDHETSILAAAMMAVLAAGVELPVPSVAVIVMIAIFGTEIGAIVYRHTDLGTVLGYPSLFLALAMLGRFRRAYRVQTEQAQALLAETRRAQHEAERAAALTERSRIAREIHDVLAHSLGALGIQIQAAEAMLSERGDIDSALGSLARARRLVDEGLTETRRAVRALRTDAPPLPEALAALVAGGTGELSVTGEPYALGPAAGLALLRVAQEAVANVRKHGGGNPAALALAYGEHGVELRIENVTGGDGATAELPGGPGGYGLAGMHERLRLIDGDLTAGPDGDRWVVAAKVAR